FQTYYLGQYVPLADLEKSVGRLQPDYMVASISYSPSLKQLNKFLTELNERFAAINIYITGRPVLQKGFSEHTNLHFFKDATALKEEFTIL
ncbi:MAG: helix-turn-helix-type transcriptional regulator, partial [Bacteroidota bacterium]